MGFALETAPYAVAEEALAPCRVGRRAGAVAEGRAAFAPPRGPRPARAAGGDPLEDLAIRLDATAFRLARGRGAIDLAIGESLEKLFAGDRLRRLGYSRQVDFAREGLGIPARTMYAFLELARAVAGLDGLRRAVARGRVSPRKARAVAPAIRGDPAREDMLVALAASKTHPEIETVLADLGLECGGEDFVVDTLRLRMSAEMQDVLDEAIALAREVIGPGRPRWAYEEVIAMEGLAEIGDFAPDPEEEGRRRRPARRSAFVPGPEERRRRLAEWRGAERRAFLAAADSLLSLEVEVFRESLADVDAPEDLLARIRKLLALRRTRDEPFGRILETISTLELHAFLGYSTFADYARERLGIRERAARQRIWLEKRLRKLPALRTALSSGRLGYSKALLVARDATPADVEARIREAEETTWQQLERDSTAEEDRQNRAVGIRRIWGPEEAIETISAAIAAMQASSGAESGVRITPGEALAALAARFVAEWRDPVRRRRVDSLRKRVLARTDGICSTPGCSNPADHAHHIVYRSRGGPDEEWNLTAVCFRCHRAIHRGRIRVAGRAGERLRWRIGRGRDEWEIWETTGDDQVRLVGVEREAPQQV